MRSADSWIGVSGFLISCARRRATSPQAASRCACSSAVMSSNTMTKPPGLRSSPDSVVQAHIRMRRLDSPCSTSCSRHSVWPASRCALQAASNCSNSVLPVPASASGLPMTLSTSTPRIVHAAWFAVRMVRSGSSEMTPVDKPRENDREIGALGLDRLLAAPRLFARARQPLGHVVERMHQDAHLVVRGERQAHVEIALRDRARAGDQILNRTHQAPRSPERAVQRGEQRQQQHQRQRQREAGLQRLAQARLLAVTLIGGLDGVGELAEAPLDRDRSPASMRGSSPGDVQRHLHGGAHEIAAAGDRIERHVVAALANLHDHFVARRRAARSRRGARSWWRGCGCSRRAASARALRSRGAARRARAPDPLRARRARSAIARVRSRYSRMRRSSAARDNVSASSRPWRISTWNQLSMPRLRNITEK